MTRVVFGQTPPSVARRVARLGTAILLASLLAAGAGTGAVLHLEQVRGLDQALVAAAYRRAHPEGEGDDHYPGPEPPITAWIVQRGDPDVPLEGVTQVARTEAPVLTTWGGRRLALVPVEEHTEHGERHTIAAASAPAPTVARTVGAFAAAYGALSLAVALAAAAALRAAVRRSFAPIERARGEAQRVLGFGQGMRLTEDGAEEVRALIGAMNGLLDRLDGAWAAQGRFTAEAAHELRTPVATILGEVDIALRKPRSAEDYRAALDSVREEAERLGRVVQALLALDRLDAGEAERSQELVRAREIAQAALASERGRLEAAGCEVRLELAADPELEVHASLLELAVANLLRNAARHAPGAPVLLRVDAADGEVVFEVHDGGPGVPEGEAEALFDRFARAGRARRDAPEGLGLGLPLAREVARRHGGDCALTRSPLGGALARLTVRG